MFLELLGVLEKYAFWQRSRTLCFQPEPHSQVWAANLANTKCQAPFVNLVLWFWLASFSSTSGLLASQRRECCPFPLEWPVSEHYTKHQSQQLLLLPHAPHTAPSERPHCQSRCQDFVTWPCQNRRVSFSGEWFLLSKSPYSRLPQYSCPTVTSTSPIALLHFFQFRSAYAIEGVSKTKHSKETKQII